MFRRKEDKTHHHSLIERDCRLNSLLELGQIIGLNLQLKEMLLQIAQKTCEVMGADRCSVFLYDPTTDELWSMVAIGMGEEVIRIHSGVGVAGFCFQTEKIINLEDAYTHPLFNKEVDAHTGYHTRSMLCMPLYKKDGQRLGVIQLLNNKDGVFNEEDVTFLKIFRNHASIFIEMAQLQQARIDALQQSKKELEQLNKAKSRALDHLSHELRTPLAVIQGYIRILKRKTQNQTPPIMREEFFESLEKNLGRLSEIQQETDQIIRTYQDWEKEQTNEGVDHTQNGQTAALSLTPFVEQVLDDVKRRASHRNIEFHIDGGQGLILNVIPKILEECLVGLLKNAIENTPDEGLVRILLEQKAKWVQLKVMDFGIGITNENQSHLLDGLFHTLETDLYTSKKPYDFGAGGKGLDLLRIKTYGRRFGFDITLASQRCIYIPTDRDLCPGKISACSHCQTTEDCYKSGGSTFCLTFPLVT